MVPLKRELEQLRTKTYSESQFAETYRVIEREKNEMQVRIEALEAKTSALLDDFMVSAYQPVANCCMT